MIDTNALRDYSDIWYATHIATDTGLVNANGVEFSKVHLKFGGENTFFYVPEIVKDHTKITYMQWSHGFSGTYRDLETQYTTSTKFLSQAIDKGWVVSIGDDSGSSHWSTPPSMKAHRSHYFWASERWNIDKVVLAGGSMGGLTTLNLVGNDVIPKVVACAAIISVVDIPAMTTTGYTSYIYPAWKVASVEELTTTIQGLDPARDDPQKWANKNIWINAGTADTLVPKTQHGDVFVSRAATPEFVHYDVGSHTHGGPPTDEPWMTWLSGFAPSYDPNQTQEPDPVDTNPGEPPISSGIGSSGLYKTDGLQVGLYRTDNSTTRVSRV